MARVFISYAHEDRRVAAEVQRWLVAERHEVFLDHDLLHGFVGGEEWEPALYERLRWADAVVCVVTAAYRDSVWCTAEAAGARLRGSRLIPLLAEPGVHHPLLMTLQHVDYARDPAAARLAVVESLRRIEGLGWPDGRSPFPGLRPFEMDMHPAFFGRGEEVGALAELLRSPAARADGGVLLVVGPSGCGKSSLVRAGVLPVMAREADWTALAPFYPGRDPLSALAGELAVAGRRHRLDWTRSGLRERLADGDGLSGVAEDLLVAGSEGTRQRHLLVVVDQFEELFTQSEPAARAAFARALRPALAGPVQVLATIRPESLPNLLASSELAALPMRTFALGTLRSEALAEVIEGPARMAGIGVGRDLVRQLVTDTGTGEALPLLAFTLSELARGVGRGGALPVQRYREMGGVHGALRRQADDALAAASAASGRGRDDVLAGLLRLVTVDERGAPTSRRGWRDELPPPVRAELDAFIARRLLTTDLDERGRVRIGVAHEAILSAWPPLAGAITAAASGLRARRMLEQAAAEWHAAGRPRRRLVEGNQLAGVVESIGDRRLPRWHLLARWQHGGGTAVSDAVELSPRARGFLHMSIRRDSRRRQRLVAILCALLAAAVGAAAVAGAQAAEATRQQRIATGRELVAEANASRDLEPRLSLLLGVAALRFDASGAARESLLTTLVRSHLVSTLDGGSGNQLHAVAFSPDGRTLVTAGLSDAILWSVGGGAVPTRAGTLGPLPHGVQAVDFSSDGRTLVTGLSDGTVTVWDVGDRARPKALASLRIQSSSQAVDGVTFSPDGQTLAAVSEDGSGELWEVGDRVQPAPLGQFTSPSRTFYAAAFGPPDGRVLATGGLEGTTLWDLRDRPHPQPLATFSVRRFDEVHAMAFSRDGRILAAGGSPDGLASLWDVGDSRHPALVAKLSGHSDRVTGVAFSPDGRTLATASSDHDAILWDVGNPDRPARGATLAGHGSAVNGVAFSPDGRSLATVGSDFRAVLWDPRNRDRPAPSATIDTGSGPVHAAAFSVDGRTLATAGPDGTVALRDAGPPTSSPAVLGDPGPVPGALAFSPDGRTLATSSPDGAVVLWDAGDRAHPTRQAAVPGHASPVGALAFGAGGRTLLTSAGDTVERWDVSDRASPVRQSTISGYTSQAVAVAAISPDGRTLATASADRAYLWDVGGDHAAPLATVTGSSPIIDALAFSSDGRMLVTAGWYGTAVVWDVSDRRSPQRLATLGGSPSPVKAVSFSPDGRSVATTSSDDAVLWDLGNRRHPVRLATLSGQADFVDAVAFSRDGRVLAIATDSGTATLWDVAGLSDVARRAVAAACAAAGRSLTRAEWAQYAPELPYERTC